MKITIAGAGMAGLLAANMLRNHDVNIHEAQPSLPNNHSAVLRFRTSVVGDVLGLPFRAVQALRATETLGNPIADALGYSYKATGKATLRSIARVSPVPVERYIAPPSLIPIMAKRTSIVYNSALCLQDILDWQDERVIISTIPMPVMMDIVGWEHKPNFNSRQGFNIVVKLKDTEAFVSLYVPNPSHPFHRVSITGDELIIEHAHKEKPKHLHQPVQDAMEMLGLPRLGYYPDSLEIREQKYAKILPIDEASRKMFIHHLTDKYGVYSLGRFACWRPGLLLDDVVQDVRAIERMVAETTYDWRK